MINAEKRRYWKNKGKKKKLLAKKGIKNKTSQLRKELFIIKK